MRAVVAISLAVALSACSTTGSEPVTLWWPDPYSAELAEQAERNAAVCRAEAVKATSAQAGNTQIVYGGQHGNPLLFSLVQQGQAEARQNEKIAAVYEGCMYERGYRKIVTTQDELDEAIAKAASQQ